MPTLLADEIFSCENVLNVSDVSGVLKVSDVSSTSIFKSHFCSVYIIEVSDSGTWTAQNNQAHAVADATGNAQTSLTLPAHSESPYSVQLTPDVSSWN